MKLCFLYWGIPNGPGYAWFHLVHPFTVAPFSHYYLGYSAYILLRLRCLPRTISIPIPIPIPKPDDNFTFCYYLWISFYKDIMASAFLRFSIAILKKLALLLFYILIKGLLFLPPFGKSRHLFLYTSLQNLH